MVFADSNEYLNQLHRRRTLYRIPKLKHIKKLLMKPLRPMFSRNKPGATYLRLNKIVKINTFLDALPDIHLDNSNNFNFQQIMYLVKGAFVRYPIRIHGLELADTAMIQPGNVPGKPFDETRHVILPTDIAPAFLIYMAN